jgi:DNA mismatch repair protein MutL
MQILSKQILRASTRPTIYLDIKNATQLLKSYIITANESSIVIIDQHAASERYFYESYLKSIKSNKVVSKILLFPEVVSVEDFEYQVIEKHKTLFNRLGFDFEIFGTSEIKFTHVPEMAKLNDFSKIIHMMISDILEHDEVTNIEDKIYHEIAAILACHTAVRFGDTLTKEEIEQIISNLTRCEDPYNCPHGRPIIQEMSKYDIEKKFKRCGL